MAVAAHARNVAFIAGLGLLVVESAFTGVPACPGDHDCCVPGGPDEACCELVCLFDPFCCDVRWDGICVDEAEVHCGCGAAPCSNAKHGCCLYGEPGCSDPECCALICSLIPFCCEVAWDANCIDEAQARCGCVPPPPPCPNPKHGCCLQGGPGCSDDECCNVICAVDPFCCQTAWDQDCVSYAQMFCFCFDIENDNCDDAITTGEACDIAFVTIGSTTDGPPHASCSSIEQDIWYDYTATFTGNVRISLCGSSFNTNLAVYSGCACDLSDANLMACNDDHCGLQSEVILPVIAGQCYKIRAGGNGTSAGEGSLTIAELAGTGNCVGDIAGNAAPDGIVDVEDLLAVINGWGPCACNTPCVADIAGYERLPDGTVDVDDLLAVINNWGACE